MIRVKLDKGAKAPTRAHEQDAGLDIYMPEDMPETWFDRQATIKTGVHVEIPEGYAGLIKSKSGLNVHKDITAEGVIDAGYTGEVVIKLYNHGCELRCIKPGEKIAQLVIVPCLTEEVEVVDEICGGERGDQGFGSTGRF